MATRRKAIRKPASKKARAKSRLSKKPSKAVLTARAIKGWKTRRRNANPLPNLVKELKLFKALGATIEDISDVVQIEIDRMFARGGIKTLAHARLAALKLDAFLDGTRDDDRHVLKSFVENDDERWLNYLQAAEDAGFDSEDARDYWFSPEM